MLTGIIIGAFAGIAIVKWMEDGRKLRGMK